MIFILKHDNTNSFAHKACRAVVGQLLVTSYSWLLEMLLVMTINPTELLEIGQDELEGWWGDADTIREEHSVSRGDGSRSSGLRRRRAPPSHATVMGSSHRFSQLRLQMWRQSAHICQEGLSVYTGSSLQCQHQHQAPELVALKQKRVHLMRRPCDCGLNAGKIYVTHFFPNDPCKLLFIDDKSRCGYGTVMINPLTHLITDKYNVTLCHFQHRHSED